jgi:anthranilate synthase component II
MMKLLLVDNYDSFTWNLYHYLDQLAEEVEVYRNDQVECLEVHRYDGVVISPGPGLPGESEFTMEVIARAAGTVPLLGICLGLQSIVMHYGGNLINLKEVLHGKQRETTILDKYDPLFHGIGPKLLTGHYHSWAPDPETMPETMIITAIDQDGHIMAARHRCHQVAGVQFHPESILTPEGFTIIGNWVQLVNNHHPPKQ